MNSGKDQKRVIGDRFSRILFLLAISAAVGGGLGPELFPQSSPPSPRGILQVQIKDHREAISDFSQLEVTIDAIRISPKVGLMFWRRGWRDLKPSVERVDLTKYAGTRSATVFRGDLPPGVFDALHLKLKEVKPLHKSRNNVPVRNLIGPVEFAFSIQASKETLIVLDLTVMDLSDHPPRAYELQMKGLEVYSDGKFTDKIPPG